MSKRDKQQAAVKLRKIPTQRRSQEMCEVLILATARVLMNSQESQNWSTNQVAKEAGVSVGSLYQYYPNKEALVAALIKKYIENEIPLIRQKIDELKEYENRAEAFRQIILFLMGLYSKNKKLRRRLEKYWRIVSWL
jgi:AcrR family transcriptional regulator